MRADRAARFEAEGAHRDAAREFRAAADLRPTAEALDGLQRMADRAK